MADEEKELNVGRIEGVERTAISKAPLVGVLMLDTDDGDLVFTINETVADMFKKALEEFLLSE